MRSPGRPGVNQLDSKRAFWKCIAQGMETEAAALACNVSQPLGPRWFREAGVMAPIDLAPHSGRYLSFSEREEIALLWAQDCSVREISRRLERSPVNARAELTHRGCGYFLGLIYVANPRLSRYSMG
ncbi:helix-turn-helix domain-containing protein, partial [Cupriavidus sp. SIMBA_020]